MKPKVENGKTKGFLIKHSRWILLAIIAFGGILRLWQLGTIPTGLSNDDTGYMYSAYSIWENGHDIAGKFLPLSINLDNSFSPIFVYTDAPFVGLLGLSAFSGRLPVALLGIASIPILYLLVTNVYSNKKIALLSALLLAISPWDLMASRSATDAGFALFFYLLGLYLFIRYRKNYHMLWSLIPFFIAFYSYHATKLFFVVLIPILLVYYFRDMIRNRKAAFLFLAGILALCLSFIYVTQTQSVTRQDVLLWNNPIETARVVNNEREYSTAPQILKAVFSNKFFIYFTTFRNNYLEAFSPEFLLLYGEPSGLKKQFSVQNIGQLYLIEGVFLLIGIYWTFRLGLPKLPFLLLLICPLPAAFSGDLSYFNRSIMMIPFLVIITALGMFYLYEQLKKYKLVYLAGVVAIYLILFTQYLYAYYFRYPLYSADGWFEQSKTISLFAEAHQQEYDHIYINHAGSMFLLQYGLYNRIDPKIISAAWKSYPKARIGRVSFVENYCNEDMPVNFYHYPKNSLLIVPGDCYKSTLPYTTIVDKAESQHVLWKLIKI